MNLIEPTWWRRKPGPRGTTRNMYVGDVPWRVFEYIEGTDHPGQVSLIFASDSAWRRIRVFPADWATFDDAALYALSCPAAPRAA